MAAQQKKKSSKDAGGSNSVRANGKAWKKGKDGVPVPPEVRLLEEQMRLIHRKRTQSPTRTGETARKQLARGGAKAKKIVLREIERHYASNPPGR